MSPDFGYVIVGLGAAALTFFGVIITTRGSDKANARTEGVNALKGGVETWQDLYRGNKEELEKLRATTASQVKELQDRMTQAESDMRTVKRELSDTQVVLADSLDLNVEFIRWAKDGAQPPPPSASTYRLRQRLEQIINHE